MPLEGPLRRHLEGVWLTERRAGEMLAEMVKQGPGQYKRLHDETVCIPPRLSDLGITKVQSHRWQIEAERRAGEMLAEMEKNPGGQPEQGLYRLDDQTSRIPTLSSLGISKFQSHRWP